MNPLPARSSGMFRLTMCLLGVLVPVMSMAQWMIQDIVLRPGWNAVHLQVQPEPRQCEQVFAGLSVNRVWMWNGRQASEQYLQDPNTLRPEDPSWLGYVHAGDPASSVSTLANVLGGRCYLIHSSASTARLWQVKGVAVATSPTWIADSMNLVGFPVGTTNGPSLGEFFAASPAHKTGPFYRLSSAGSWQEVLTPSSAAMRDGEAFFVRSVGPSSFPGLLGVELEQIDRLAYGRLITEQLVRVKNHGLIARNLRLGLHPIVTPPAGREGVAGPVPLSWYNDRSTNAASRWEPLPENLDLGVLQPGAEVRLRLAIRREALNPPSPTAGTNRTVYQSVMEVSDGAKLVRKWIPVTAEADQPAGISVGGRPAAPASGGPVARTGLWVGHAVLDAVNQPTHRAEPFTPRAAAGEAAIKLIVHVDALGRARLLQSVTELFERGSRDAQGRQLTGGHGILVSDPKLVDRFSGSGLRDGRPIGRRHSSAAFAFREPRPMSGSFGIPGASLGCEITLEHLDPVNPFLHRYHPNHDGLNRDYDKPLAEGEETFRVTRRIRLDFAAADPFKLDLPEYGSRHVGGFYRETILGIHKDALLVEGRFRLHRISEIATLNNEAP